MLEQQRINAHNTMYLPTESHSRLVCTWVPHSMNCWGLPRKEIHTMHLRLCAEPVSLCPSWISMSVAAATCMGFSSHSFISITAFSHLIVLSNIVSTSSLPKQVGGLTLSSADEENTSLLGSSHWLWLMMWEKILSKYGTNMEGHSRICFFLVLAAFLELYHSP